MISLLLLGFCFLLPLVVPGWRSLAAFDLLSVVAAFLTWLYYAVEARSQGDGFILLFVATPIFVGILAGSIVKGLMLLAEFIFRKR